MNILRIGLLLTIFLLCLACANAQSKTVKNINAAFTVGMSYGSNISIADLADRYGSHAAIGLDLEWITRERSFIFGVNNRYHFGTNVNEDVLSSLRGVEGQILGIDNTFSSVFLRQRGLYTGVVVGKIFKTGNNAKAGIRVSNTTGLWMHWIRLQDDFDSVPQIDGLYRAGYDRLTTGLAFQQFIGYQNLSSNKRINFMIGLEFTEGFTKNRRDINYNTQLPDNTSRFDMTIGIKAGLMLPFYKGSFTADDDETFY